VNNAQILVGRNRSSFHDLDEVLGPRLHNRHVADQVKCLLGEGTLIVLLRGAVLGRSQGLRYFQPGPVGDLWIIGRQIRAGDLHVDQRLSRGFVLRVAQAPGLVTVVRAQTRLLAGEVILEIKSASVGSAIQAESLLHNVCLS
jgi:hypothetical protein